MLTLGWAVDQSRRVLRARRRGRKVHPDGTPSSRGATSESAPGGGEFGTPSSARSGRRPRPPRPQPPRSTCFDVFLTLMGFGRGGKRLRAAAEGLADRRARGGAEGGGGHRTPRSEKRHRGGGASHAGSPAAPPSRAHRVKGSRAQSAMQFTPTPGSDVHNAWQNPSPASRGDPNAHRGMVASWGGDDASVFGGGTRRELLAEMDEVSTR